MKRLSEKEFEIMKILWEKASPMTSGEILEAFNGNLGWKLSSLMTVLERMAKKDYVHCDRSTRTNYYTATVAEDEYKAWKSESLLHKLFEKSATKFIASLCEKDKISKDEIENLKEYLDSLGRDAE